ncbi:SgrR family transcriptional regulator [Paenibacillus turpanensis]|uniref:SgrR family transcriptional regulator n=1 Tax=Paenibacillus turpanensis TaxID=2689078 RepID=UPI0014078DFA|nr:SgrR family transcriptional regulator [Paenibacillus turpanensis]
MQALEHFIRLQQHFKDAVPGETVRVTLDELAGMLCCTRRNVNFIIKNMEAQNWVRWTPGRGRGNSSSLTFIADARALLQEAAVRYVSTGDVEGALALLGGPAKEGPGMDAFISRFLEEFGFFSEPRPGKRKDVLRFPFYRPLGNLDPAYLHRRTEAHMSAQLFDTLLRYDPSSKEVLPHLAHHWECSPDLTEWHLYLRKGVRFHHGKVMTAEDAAYTLERVMDPANSAPYRWLCRDIKEVSVLSETCLKLTLHRPNRMLPVLLSSSRLGVVPSDKAPPNDPEFARLPIGTGPYKLTRNDSSMVVFEANEAYFKERPLLDAVEMWIVPDSLPANDAHLSPFGKQLSESGPFTLLEQPETGSTYICFNRSKEGPMQNRSFRKALHHAIDRERFVEELGGFRITPAASFFPDATKKRYKPEYDPVKAKKHLEKSGYDGQAIHMYTYEMAVNHEDCAWIQEEWAKLGVNTIVTALPAEELFRKERIAEADVLLSGVVFSGPAELELMDLFLSDNSVISTHLDVEAQRLVDEALSDALSRSDPEKCVKKLLQIEELLYKDYSVLFLAHLKQVSQFHSSLQGVRLNELGWFDFSTLWFEPSFALRNAE